MNTMTINITLPVQMKKAVDARVKNGFYTSFSEFVRNAVRFFLAIPPTIPCGPAFSPAAKKEALKNRNKNIVIKNSQELKDFFKNQ